MKKVRVKKNVQDEEEKKIRNKNAKRKSFKYFCVFIKYFFFCKYICNVCKNEIIN
jgi:hypothetical protein